MTLGKMVINPDVTVRSRGLWKNVYVYSKETKKRILDA